MTSRRRITDNAAGAGGRRFPAARPVLCLVTDRARLRSRGVADDVGATLALIRRAAAAGIDLVQIRETGLTDRALGNLVERAVEAALGKPTRILVNDRVDIALAHGADGVHLKGESVPAARVREHAGADWIVGRSIHGLEEGREVAAGGGLDYVSLGTVFATASKPGRRPLGAGLLRQTAAALPLPVLAIGGVTRERVTEIAVSGAAGVAAIGMFADLAGLPQSRFGASVAALRAAWSQ